MKKIFWEGDLPWGPFFYSGSQFSSVMMNPVSVPDKEPWPGLARQVGAAKA